MSSLPATTDPARFCYRRVENDHLRYVIVDIFADGREDWAEQYAGELRWYPFAPSEADREMVRRWLRSRGAHQPFRVAAS
jgi:hypothetical protein